MTAPTLAAEAFLFWQIVRGARAMHRVGVMTGADRHTAMEDLAVIHVNTEWSALKDRTHAAIAELNREAAA